VQGSCATALRQPQVQLDPTQGLQAHAFRFCSFMMFLQKG